MKKKTKKKSLVGDFWPLLNCSFCCSFEKRFFSSIPFLTWSVFSCLYTILIYLTNLSIKFVSKELSSKLSLRSNLSLVLVAPSLFSCGDVKLANFGYQQFGNFFKLKDSKSLRKRLRNYWRIVQWSIETLHFGPAESNEKKTVIEQTLKNN